MSSTEESSSSTEKVIRKLGRKNNCKHTYKNGVKKGKVCGRQCSSSRDFCYQHYDQYIKALDKNSFLMLQATAEDDLDQYIEDYEHKNEEVCAEAEIMRAELDMCKTKDEIAEFMIDYGW